MDIRKPLSNGYVLKLGDIEYIIDSVSGFGANAYVYVAKYYDNIVANKTHKVLIKELFPYHPKGFIFRDEEFNIVCLDEAKNFFELQKSSFIRGNSCHIDFQRECADMASVNFNSYESNSTLYTVMGNLGGETLYSYWNSVGSNVGMYEAVVCVLNVLDALEPFHEQGLLHLDVSPDNILMIPLAAGKSERFRKMILIDYNSAYTCQDVSNGNLSYFSIKGGYSAPEIRLQDLSSVSFSTDLFSVACIFLEFLSNSTINFSQLYTSSNEILFDSRFVESVPETAISLAKAIISKGLRMSPRRRYQSVKEMRGDFEELLLRLDGVGVTHSALWEKSREYFIKYKNSVQPQNPLVCRERFVEPVLRSPDGKELSFNEFCTSDKNVCVYAPGGMGKTTLLLSVLKNATKHYDPKLPVPVYIPLYRCRSNSARFITDSILTRLHFDKKTATAADAAAKLDVLFSSTLKGHANVVLLLDGYNEVPGRRDALINEIEGLCSKAGVRVILSSRNRPSELKLDEYEILPYAQQSIARYLSACGVLYPDNKKLQTLLTNPMLLEIYTRVFSSLDCNALEMTGEDELLDAYLQYLIDAYSAQNFNEDDRRSFADAGLCFIAPYFCAYMMESPACSLSAQQLDRLIKRCYKHLHSRYFLKAFPNAMGVVSKINTPQELYTDIIEAVLIRQTAVFTLDEQGNLRVFHQNFGEHMAKKYKPLGSTLDKRRKIKNTVVAATAISAVLFLSAGGIYAGQSLSQPVVKTIYSSEITFPETQDEIDVVKQAMSLSGAALSKLDSCICTDLEMLKALEAGNSEPLLNPAERYIPIRHTSESLNAYFIPRAVYSKDELLNLLNLPCDYTEWSENMYKTLTTHYENNARGEQLLSLLPLYRKYIEEYLGYAYCCMDEAVCNLNDTGKDFLFSALQYTSHFSKMYIERGISSEKSQAGATKDIALLNVKKRQQDIYSYGG